MMASLFAGVSGLRNHMVRMNLVGDNIANINTIGFKTGRVTFREALVQTLRGAGRPSASSGGTNPVQLGLGMQVATVDNLFTQGGLETTGQLTDLALQGSGFFILSDGNQEYYTRAGAFGLDANSNLVNPANGFFVQGKMANTTGSIPATTAIGNINLPFGQQDPAKKTTEVFLANNLDATATTSEASLFSAGSTNIDSIAGLAANGAGGSHSLTITGAQSTNSMLLSDGAFTLNLNDTLGTLGVSVTELSISVDGGPMVPIAGLTTGSTIGDMITEINKVQGITASFDAATGRVNLTRDYAGNGATYNAVSSTSVAGDIMDVLFSVDPAGADPVMRVNSGTAHTFVIEDTFTPTGGTAITPPVALDVSLNPTTGKVTGITGLGNGGVTILSSTEIAAGTAVIETKDTQHATSITTYDSQGGKHTIVFTFTKQADANKWVWEASPAGNEIATAGKNGTVTFNTDGSLKSFVFASGDRLSVDPNNGAATMNIGLFAGTTGDFDGLTGFSSNFSAIAKGQDGYGMGMLDKISIDERGVITGIFTNGVSRTLAQLILGDFNNPGGLLKAGDTLYNASANSGDVVRGVAGSTINASISSGALEGSNVDLAEEFTSVIVAQRGFQANARVIATSDQLLNELVNLKT